MKKTTRRKRPIQHTGRARKNLSGAGWEEDARLELFRKQRQMPPRAGVSTRLNLHAGTQVATTKHREEPCASERAVA
eukprot:6091881-Pleurochrysis_carterae.AAC.1